MLKMDFVEQGIRAILDFNESLIDDLEEKAAGFEGWSHNFADLNTAREVADYIVGSTQAIGSNLQAVAVHLQTYQELRYQQDSAMKLLLSTTGNWYPRPRTSHFDEKELRLDVCERAFYVTVGSVLDCLTATLIGLAGLKLDIHRADSGLLLPLTGLESYPSKPENRNLFESLMEESPGREAQVKAIRAVATAFRQSGPEQWLDWTLGMRNMVVHREHRGEIVSADQQKDRSYLISRLPPANPNLSNLQGFRAGGDKLDDYYLHEDLGKTLVGIAGSVNAAVAASVVSLRALWDDRKMRPNLIVQPVEQWKTNERPIAFGGYDPGGPSLSKKSSLTLSPTDWKRLLAGGVGTPNGNR